MPPTVSTVSTHELLAAELAAQREILNDCNAGLELADPEELDPAARSDLLAQRQTALERIAEITAALHRLADGTYGTCDHCGGAIAAARLEALPTARHCIRCAIAARHR